MTARFLTSLKGEVGLKVVHGESGLERTIVITDRWVNNQLVRGMKQERLIRAMKRFVAELPILSNWLSPVAVAPAVAAYIDLVKIISRELEMEEIMLDHSKILECKDCSSAKQDLQPIIGRMKDFQALIYSTASFFRDHILHQIRVATLGDFLLSQVFVFAERKSLIKLISDLLRISEDEVRRCWWIAGLFHDIGMPIVQVNDSVRMIASDIDATYDLDFTPSTSPILGLRNSPENNTLLNWLLEQFSASEDRRVIENASGLADTGKRLDHGVVGALCLLAAVSKSGSRPERLYLEAGRAMCVHSLNISFSFEDNPLGFLLVICDEMQEWSRDVKVHESRGFAPLAEKVRLTKRMNLTLSEAQVHAKVVFDDQKAKDRCGFRFDRLARDKERNFARLSVSTAGFPSVKVTLVDKVFHGDTFLTEIPREIAIARRIT